MAKEHKLTFSVSGAFITNLAREKCYLDNDIAYALNLLTNCLQSDQLSENEIMGLAFQVLDGTMQIVGTYPEKSYGIEEVPNAEPKLMAHFKHMRTLIEESKKKEALATQKLCCLAENIPEYMQRDINEAWEDYGYSEPIFPGVKKQDRTPFLHPLDGIANQAVTEYLERMTSDKNVDEDYGWLEPDGTFHPVEWGRHQGWAREYFEQHDHTAFEEIMHGKEPGDILTERRWVLLHNPAQGLARPTYDPARGMTKKQKEFLFDYYIERGKEKMAYEYIDD